MVEQPYDVLPWDEIPDEDVVENGDYLVKGMSLEDGESSTGKRMLGMEVKVLEPAQFAGMTLFENFVTGDDANPKAVVPSSFGTRRLKRALKAAQIPQSNSMQQVCAGFAGTTFGISVAKYQEKDGEYAGSWKNRINGYWKVGERTPAVRADSGARGPGAASAAAAAAVHAPMMPGMPQGRMAQPQAQAAPQQWVPPQGAPSPAAPPPQGMQPPQPMAPPPTQAPVQQMAQVPPQQFAQPAPQVAAEPQVMCPICGGQVANSQFASHVMTCAASRGVGE